LESNLSLQLVVRWLAGWISQSYRSGVRDTGYAKVPPVLFLRPPSATAHGILAGASGAGFEFRGRLPNRKARHPARKLVGSSRVKAMMKVSWTVFGKTITETRTTFKSSEALIATIWSFKCREYPIEKVWIA
jgi:hypothetical protein